MTQPAFTVAIVTYHTSLYVLMPTIESLRRCSLPFELVIVDNTMDDEYFANLQRETGVKCIRSTHNGGYGYGHNLALPHLPAAPYHLVLNPDVILHAGSIEALVGMLDHEPDVGLCTPRILNRDGTLQALNKLDPTVLDLVLRRFLPKWMKYLPFVRNRMDYFTMMDKGYDKPTDIYFASGCCMMFRREILQKIGGFDERFFMYFEDADISRRVREFARVRYCPEAVITHFWARGSYNNFGLMMATFKSAKHYFDKWGWRWW